MISARRLMIFLLICFAADGVVFGLIVLGVDQLRPVGFVITLFGALTVLASVLGVWTGRIKNDLRDQ